LISINAPLELRDSANNLLLDDRNSGGNKHARIVCHNWGPKSTFFIVAKRGDAGTGEYTV